MRIGRLLVERYSTPFNTTLAIRWLTDAGLEAYFRVQADKIAKAYEDKLPRDIRTGRGVAVKPSLRSIGRG